MTKKKKPVKKKRPPKKDFAQIALAVVEKAIGGKLATRKRPTRSC